MFKPHVPLGWMAGITGLLGLVPFIRFLIYTIQGEGGGHVQSLIFGSAMLVASLLSIALLVIADLLRTNRVLIEESLERVKTLQYSQPFLEPDPPSTGTSLQGSVQPEGPEV